MPSEQRTYAAMEHHMHTIRLQRTTTHADGLIRVDARRVELDERLVVRIHLHRRHVAARPALSVALPSQRCAGYKYP